MIVEHVYYTVFQSPQSDSWHHPTLIVASFSDIIPLSPGLCSTSQINYLYCNLGLGACSWENP